MEENLLLLRDLSEPEEQELQAYDCSIKNVYSDKLGKIVNKIHTIQHIP